MTISANRTGNASDTDELGYRPLELDVVNKLRILHEFALNLEMSGTLGIIEAVLKDIEQHSFRLAVVGEFKRGKSTFINALLGKPILPSGVLPTTATLNRVTYGLTPRICIKFKPTDGQPGRIEEIRPDQIANYVTKLTEEAAMIATTIEEAVVYYPVPYCQNGNVDIIDTPGISDEEHLTAITKGVLPKVHAAIMVVMATAPFSETEAQFLDYLLGQNVSKVLFVVSGIDLIDEDDREKVIGHIKQRIEKRLAAIAEKKFGDDPARMQEFLSQVGVIRVFGVSGHLALQAKEKKDEALRIASGFIEMEAALDKFLTEESGTIALQSWTNHLLAVASEISEQVEEHLARCRRRSEAIKSNCDVSAALAEVLRQMLEVDVQRLEQSFAAAVEELSYLSSTLETEVVEVVDSVIGSHKIETRDFAPVNSEEFHQRLADKLNDASNEVTRRLALRAHVPFGKKLEGELKQVVRTGVAFDRVVRHIEVLAKGFDERIRVDTEASLMRDLTACVPPPSADLEESLRLSNVWMNNLFQTVRLPSGSFNWASQTYKDKTFKHELKRRAADEIRALLARQDVGGAVFKWVQQCFAQLKLKLDAKRGTVEGLQFELYGGKDRAETLIAQRVGELERMQDKISRITAGKQVKVSV